MKKLVYSAIALAVSVLSLTSCEDVPAPYTLPTASENTEIKVAPKGSGTAEDPFNVVALDSLMDNEFDANATYYVKGVVSQVGTFNESFGNITYYIKDEEASTTFYVYRGLGLGGANFTSESDIAIGDSVVVAGNVTIYNGTKEFVTNKSHIVYLNGKTASNSGTSTAEPTGTGTETDPYNVAAVLKLYENNSYDSNKEVYVKGIVAKVGSIDTVNYGNATYYISDDGTSTNDFEIYHGFYLNGEKFTSKSQLKKGQTVVVCGKLTLYNTTKEMDKESKLISIEGEGTSTESGSEAAGQITTSSFNLTDAAEWGTQTLTDGTKIIAEAGTGSNSPKFYIAGSGTLRVYPGNTLTFEATKNIKSITILCDSYNGINYTAQGMATASVGTIALNELTYTISDINSNKVVLTNSNTNTGGKSQLRILSFVINYAN
ncbi:hypothetical protein [Segatella bryantii]|uniref:Lipoprotein n=1 Tax=Segatella bryantii TaxID=77095 RepID=A0ABX4EJ38_SEGBR|nr:hypothetical protein [Segatella bryantii]OYP56324.1 hypothetical protein CIK91_03110 [Segatella bryantii]UKK80358.1 hypothetical protein L6474_06750 [Segatella bryantii]